MSQQRVQKFRNHSALEGVQIDVNETPPPTTAKVKKWVKALTFTATEIKFSFQSPDSSRILNAIEPEKLLTADFQGLYFENQPSSTYITRILTKGIAINRKYYHYLGQSNSLIKDRKCLLVQMEEKEIEQFLNTFGDWSKFNNIAKLAKRIGLLFSSGNKVLDLPTKMHITIDDVERDDHCFTDGCGLISKTLIKEISLRMKLKFRDRRLYPSVIQIRYQGFKGILLCGKVLKDGMKCHFRKSMAKFKYLGPDDFCVVEYSKPYTFGRLNAQIVMLLSSLGVPDDALLHKQKQHYERLDSMLKDLSIAFEYLLTTGEVDLANDLMENGLTDRVRNRLKSLYKKEVDTSFKTKKGRDGTSMEEKLRIIVQDSRLVFAAADPTGRLRENECFFRPTIANKPTTILGPIFCVRNPCYHAGDIVVLNAVELPESVCNYVDPETQLQCECSKYLSPTVNIVKPKLGRRRKRSVDNEVEETNECKGCGHDPSIHDEFEDITDVLVFSVNGDVPAAHRSAGGDLDGDKFFVCWDPELMPPKEAESYGYPGNKQVVDRDISRVDLIKHFANHSNAGVSRCANAFMKWAEAKGPRCEECIEINKLFSQAVDGSSVSIPKRLRPPEDTPQELKDEKIWNKLISNAEERREEMKRKKQEKERRRRAAENEDDDDDDDEDEDDDVDLRLTDRDGMLEFLKEECPEATDYEMLCILIRWCHVNKVDITEFLYYINFSTYTMDEKRNAIATGRVPIQLMLNALNESQIVDFRHMKHFELHEESSHWKLFHQKSEVDVSTCLVPDLLKAISNFRRVFVALNFDHELIICISFFGDFKPNVENDCNGKIDVYGFSRSGAMKSKKRCHGDYKLFYDETHLQIYISNIRNTFVWLGLPKKVSPVAKLNDLNVNSSISVAVDKLSHQTARITSRIQKRTMCVSEIYIISNKEGLNTKYQVVNPEHKIEREKLDIDATYNPPDVLNPDENDIELLKTRYSDNWNKLKELMECWIRYGLYNRVIKAYEKYLETNNTMKDLRKLIEFSSNIPVVYGTLTDFVKSQSEIPGSVIVDLIELCLKGSKCKDDAVVMQTVINLLNCSVTLSMKQVFDIVNHIVLFYPYPKVALDYLIKVEDEAEGEDDEDEESEGDDDKDEESEGDDEDEESKGGNETEKKETDSNGLVKGRYRMITEPEDRSRKFYRRYRRRLDLQIKRAYDQIQESNKPQDEKDVDYPELFDVIKQKLEPPVEVPDIAVDHFLRLAKMLCIETLAEFSENSKDRGNRNLYVLQESKTKKKNKYRIVSIGKFTVRVQTGDVILLKRLNQNTAEPIPAIRAVVTTFDPEITVEVSFSPRDILMATWRIEKVGTTVTGYRQSMAAIDTLCPVTGEDITPLLDILLEPEKFSTEETIETDQTDQGSSTESLNPSQRFAVNQAKDGVLTLWQGPAGTGKTNSIYQLTLSLLSLNPELPILVTGATNAAVDNIARKLIDHPEIKDKIIRIGDTRVVQPELIQITLEAGMDGSVRRMDPKHAQQKLKEAKIIFATCVGSGTSLLDDFKYDFIIVDEASQVSEPHCLIPLAKNCERFLLVGDHKQLRPFCMKAAERVGYSISLFERMNESEYPVCLLDTQYRMHPGVSDFPNIFFYKGKLKDGVSEEERPLVDGFTWPNQKVPVAFVQVKGNEENSKSSKYNQAEVEKVFEMVEKILEAGGVESKDIGIISLYKAQLDKMKSKLGTSKIPSAREGIEVKTADGFQGREKDLILITCVRCNENGKVGFLNDPRRFNVMLTRARRGLVIFGDRKTLCADDMWKEWFEWCDQKGLYVEEVNEVNEEGNGT